MKCPGQQKLLQTHQIRPGLFSGRRYVHRLSKHILALGPVSMSPKEVMVPDCVRPTCAHGRLSNHSNAGSDQEWCPLAASVGSTLRERHLLVVTGACPSASQ